MTTTSDKRRPLNIEFHGYGTVSSTQQYTVEEAADIRRMLTEVFDYIADGREELRIRPSELQVVKDAIE